MLLPSIVTPVPPRPVKEIFERAKDLPHASQRRHYIAIKLRTKRQAFRAYLEAACERRARAHSALMERLKGFGVRNRGLIGSLLVKFASTASNDEMLSHLARANVESSHMSMELALSARELRELARQVRHTHAAYLMIRRTWMDILRADWRCRRSARAR